MMSTQRINTMDEFMLEAYYREQDRRLHNGPYYGDSESNMLDVELDYDPQLSLDGDSIEHTAWLESIVIDESQTYHALHDYGDDLPDYF